MNSSSTLILVCAIETLLSLGVIYFVRKRLSRIIGDDGTHFESDLLQRDQLHQSVQEMHQQLIDIRQLATRAKQLKGLRDALRVDRGRVTITYAELETIESRLRELHEIERELLASGLETQEELKILKRKEEELISRNEALKAQLDESLSKLAEIQNQMEFGAEISQQLETMKSELIATRTNTDLLLIQIEQGNQLYSVLKRRYDALDIEYAQLFEKFSENSLSLKAEK